MAMKDAPHLGDPFALWCGFCGAVRWFGQVQWKSLRVEPSCPRCGEKDWRDQVDEITAPDHKEP